MPATLHPPTGGCKAGRLSHPMTVQLLAKEEQRWGGPPPWWCRQWPPVYPKALCSRFHFDVKACTEARRLDKTNFHSQKSWFYQTSDLFWYSFGWWAGLFCEFFVTDFLWQLETVGDIWGGRLLNIPVGQRQKLASYQISEFFVLTRYILLVPTFVLFWGWTKNVKNITRYFVSKMLNSVMHQLRDSASSFYWLNSVLLAE